VIGSSRRLKVYLCREPVDMRKSFNTLSAVVEQAMGREVLSGELFAFINKKRKRAKVLWWDGTGLCLLAKRLEDGRFMAPWQRAGEGPIRMTANELSLLLEGSEWVGRLPLSPPAYRPGPLPLRWG
jgi:transposase